MELLVSIGVSTMVLGALVSTVMLSVHAVPDRDDPIQATVGAGDLLGRIAAELQYATVLSEQTATAVTFDVADRDNDSLPETIRYAWSGTAGDPLTRQYNGNGPGTLAVDVHEFDLSYVTKMITTQEMVTVISTRPSARER